MALTPTRTILDTFKPGTTPTDLSEHDVDDLHDFMALTHLGLSTWGEAWDTGVVGPDEAVPVIDALRADIERARERLAELVP